MIKRKSRWEGGGGVVGGPRIGLVEPRRWRPLIGGEPSWFVRSCRPGPKNVEWPLAKRRCQRWRHRLRLSADWPDFSLSHPMGMEERESRFLFSFFLCVCVCVCVCVDSTLFYFFFSFTRDFIQGIDCSITPLAPSSDFPLTPPPSCPFGFLFGSATLENEVGQKKILGAACCRRVGVGCWWSVSSCITPHSPFTFLFYFLFFFILRVVSFGAPGYYWWTLDVQEEEEEDVEHVDVGPVSGSCRRRPHRFINSKEKQSWIHSEGKKKTNKQNKRARARARVVRGFDFVTRLDDATLLLLMKGRQTLWYPLFFFKWHRVGIYIF